MAFEHGAGVLEVPFGVGLGGGDAVKGLIEEGDDAVLFGERGKWKLKAQNFIHLGTRHSRTGTCCVDAVTRLIRKKPIKQIFPREFGTWLERENFC